MLTQANRECVLFVSAYTLSWMTMCTDLFPLRTRIYNKEDLVTMYDHSLGADARPLMTASFLVTFAITVLQIPDREQDSTLLGWEDPSSCARAISHTVESTIISHDGMLSTEEGMEVALLFVRL